MSEEDIKEIKELIEYNDKESLAVRLYYAEKELRNLNQELTFLRYELAHIKLNVEESD